MIELTVEEILNLHQKLSDRTGGAPCIRDMGLLESAVYSANQSFGGEYVYSSTEERAARLEFAITKNHPFADGNKRTGVLAMLMTLRLNNIRLKYTQEELITLGLSAADGTFGYDEILRWINEHK